MRLGIVLLLVLLAMPAGAVHEKESAAKSPDFNLRVKPGDWGSARAEDVETLLNAAARELLTYFPGRHLAPLFISHCNDTPIVLYERGPEDEYQVQLCAANTRWSQYVYEFAHELCHVLSNYERHVAPGMSRRHQWFEESLCEAASLYTLRRMAITWRVSAPNPEWAAYAPRFAEFAERFYAEPHRHVASASGLPLWFAQHQNDLSRNPYLRQHNEVVANVILPLFERLPETWGALSYLNLDPASASASFFEYLRYWHVVVPDTYKPLTSEVLALFGANGARVSASADPGAFQRADIGPAGSPAH